jgi:pSer/pThr/pTyr-binding forkhead associated (FHA) protein
VIVKLICQDSLASPREVVVSQFPAEIGRGSESSLQIDDRWLSRRHCRLELAEGAVLVRDLGSRHGTFVNGRQISECKLLPGDELCIGLSHFVAEYAAPSGLPAAVSSLKPALA